MRTRWKATDLFSGCGGLTAGLKRAGFDVVSAVEINPLVSSTYSTNHPEVNLIPRDIRRIEPNDLSPEDGGKIDLVAGCPPCQGFSRVRRRNRAKAAKDEKNGLIAQFQRIIENLNPAAVFLENVPGIENDRRFDAFLARLEKLDYQVNWGTLELSDYGVPQRRSRVVVLAGKGFTIPMPRPRPTNRTVQTAIGWRESELCQKTVAVGSPGRRSYACAATAIATALRTCMVGWPGPSPPPPSPAGASMLVRADSFIQSRIVP